MVYFLKFGASLVLPPGIFFLLFFYIAWRLCVKGERPLALALFSLTFVFYLLSTGLVSERLVMMLESAYEPPPRPTGDVIIMLGGGAMPDSPDVDGVGALAASPANRLLTALRLYRKLDVPILLSGGQAYADSGREALIAKRILLSLGVPSDKIILETKSINTSQNALYSAQILRQKGFSRPIVVTSAFHMKRAVLNFAKQGIEVVPFPADFLVSHHPVFHYTKLRPQTEALLGSVTVLQETLRTFVTYYFE